MGPSRHYWLTQMKTWWCRSSSAAHVHQDQPDTPLACQPKARGAHCRRPAASDHAYFAMVGSATAMVPEC